MEFGRQRLEDLALPCSVTASRAENGSRVRSESNVGTVPKQFDLCIASVPSRGVGLTLLSGKLPPAAPSVNHGPDTRSGTPTSQASAPVRRSDRPQNNTTRSGVSSPPLQGQRGCTDADAATTSSTRPATQPARPVPQHCDCGVGPRPSRLTWGCRRTAQPQHRLTAVYRCLNFWRRKSPGRFTCHAAPEFSCCPRWSP
jgi:hypothetical protein